MVFVGKEILFKVITALNGGGIAGFTEQLLEFRLFFFFFKLLVNILSRSVHISNISQSTRALKA